MNSIILPQSPYEVFRLIARADEARRDREVSELKKELAQFPISEATLNRLSRLRVDDFEKAMHCHKGRALEQTSSSLWAMLDTFRLGWKDLQQSFKQFADFSADDSIPFSRREEQRGQILLAIRRDLLVLSVSAAALVELARRVNGELRHSEFDRYKKKTFDSSQHRFITELRNNLAHVCSLPTKWTVTYKGSQQPRSVVKFLSKDLLSVGRFNEESRRYLESAGENIDIMILFKDYCARVEQFYAWFKEEIESDARLVEYRRCDTARRAVAQRNSWRFMLGLYRQMRTDPYRHLHRVFAPDELDRIYRFPKHSLEQVDLMIAIADSHRVFDEELRILAYKLFGAITDSDASTP